MIIRENEIDVKDVSSVDALNFQGDKEAYKRAIFFDLEHYIYKKPICIGVFGCCYYDYYTNKIKVTQYMIENKKDVKEIILLSKKYLEKMYRREEKDYIITFSGNNDYTVINYLFKKYNIDFDIDVHFDKIDLQKEYEKENKTCIGLKNLEKQFNIIRQDENMISGQNLAKTFSRIIKDDDYINRMPENKKNKILLYNEQDVVSLFHIYVNWFKSIHSNI